MKGLLDSLADLVEGFVVASRLSESVADVAWPVATPSFDAVSFDACLVNEGSLIMRY